MTRDELIARLQGYEWTDFECKKARNGVPREFLRQQQLLRSLGQRTYTLTNPCRALLERNQDQADEPQVVTIQTGTRLGSSRDHVGTMSGTGDPRSYPRSRPRSHSRSTKNVVGNGWRKSRGELMTALGLKDEKYFRENYQQAGITQGVIEMTIPDKPASRNQKYRLTALGKKILESQQ